MEEVSSENENLASTKTLQIFDNTNEKDDKNSKGYHSVQPQKKDDENDKSITVSAELRKNKEYYSINSNKVEEEELEELEERDSLDISKKMSKVSKDFSFNPKGL